MSTPKIHTDPKNAAPTAAASSRRAAQTPISGAQVPAGVVQLMAAAPQQRMPQQMAPADIGYLQRTTGNRAVAQMLGRATPQASQAPQPSKTPKARPVIQASLEVGGADDRYEREADQIARRVNSAGASSGTGNPSGTGKSSGGRQSAPRPQSGSGAQISRLQRAPVIGRDGGVADAGIEGRVRGSQSGGAPLADNIRQKIEPKIGADLSSVKVHTDKNAVQLSQDLGAKAFTHGNHIFYGQGQSPSNLQLTAHEAVHTVQQGAVSQVQRVGNGNASGARAPDPISTDASDKVRRKFGFEIEVPMLLTYTDPAATDEAADQRNDAMVGSGGGVAWRPAGATFDVKVDHNLELNPLAAYEYTNNQGHFPSGASIVELVSKPMDEFALTEKQVKARGKEMATWAKAKHKQIKKGQYNIVGGYWIGSDMPGAMDFQTTMGYIQATYGIKLSSVPAAFAMTAQTNPDVPDPKKKSESVHFNLLEANRVAGAVIAAIRLADAEWNTHVPAPETNSLKGYIALLANYLLAGKDVGEDVGLAKNMIGEFFYKSDMGKMAGALPQPVLDRLDDRANGSLQAFYANMLIETGRGQNEEILPGIGQTIRQWLAAVLFGGPDFLLANMKNAYSSEYGPDYLGTGENIESSVVMENREIQFLDPAYAKKKKSMDKEFKSFTKNNKDKNNKAKLQKALAKMTDPKKYPMDKWGDMFVLVYRMVKQLNSMGTTKMVDPTI